MHGDSIIELGTAMPYLLPRPQSPMLGQFAQLGLGRFAYQNLIPMGGIFAQFRSAIDFVAKDVVAKTKEFSVSDSERVTNLAVDISDGFVVGP